MKYKFNRSVWLNVCVVILMIIGAGCKKFIEIDPPVLTPESNEVYNNDGTAAAALTGVYARMIAGNAFSSGSGSLSLKAGLSADELSNFSTDLDITQFYTNRLLNTNATFWNELYPYIYTANSAIEGLTAAQKVRPAIKQQLLGEAKFIRAFFYFYLVNLYGEVPLITSTDYNINAKAKKAPVEEVYGQIISDLNDAVNQLSTSYLGADAFTISTERTRPIKWAAAALLARAYLYKGDWLHAETTATSVINNAELYELLPDLNQVFLKNSKEAIWQLQPIAPGYNTYDANTFVLTAFPGRRQPAVLSSFLMGSFQTRDLRFINWTKDTVIDGTTYTYPFKYKVYGNGLPLTEYLMVLRLPEQYLIRSEARAQQNNLAGAQADLNIIRNRAGLSNTNATTKTAIASAILQERRVELFTEWGHRWLDIKRTGMVNGIMSTVTPLKGGTWNPDWQLYPIPLTEIQKDPNLTQNHGY